MTEEPEGWHRKSKKEDDIERHKKIPYRGTKPFEYDSSGTEVTAEDIERATKRWDKTMPEHKGLLDALITKADDD